MTANNRIAACASAALLAGFLIGPVYLPAQGEKETTSPAKPSVKKATAPQQSVVTKKKTSAKSAKRRRSRRTSYKARVARLRPQPKRIQEIQQALIAVGYLSQEPNGKWDEPTREAMRRYQEDYGFPTTGLPEAKTLMKLGLGPHPLPEDVDPSLARQAGNTSPSPPGPMTDGEEGSSSPGSP